MDRFKYLLVQLEHKWVAAELLQRWVSVSHIKAGDISHLTGISPTTLSPCIISFTPFSFYILISIYISRPSIRDDRAVIQYHFFTRKYYDFQSFEFCLYCQRICLLEYWCFYMYCLVSIIPDCMGLMYSRGCIWAGAHGGRLRKFATHYPLHLVPEEVMRFGWVKTAVPMWCSAWTNESSQNWSCQDIWAGFLWCQIKFDRVY